MLGLLQVAALIFKLFTQSFQKVWKILYAAVGLFFLILSSKVYQYRNLEYFADQQCYPRGNVYSLVLWGGFATLVYLVSDYYWHKKVDGWFQENFLTQKRYIEPQARQKRAYTIAKWAYFVLYYLGTSAIGYSILKNTNYLPHFLGGMGQYTDLLQLRNLEDYTFSMEVFYFIQFGKHFGRFIGHLFIRAEGSYYEYCLHHSLSLYLIAFSYCVNMWHIGIFVLVLHDYTDFGLILARAYKDYKFRKQPVLQVIYVHAVGSWIAMRIFIFSACCVFMAFKCVYELIELEYSAIQKQVLMIPYLYLAFMLACLEFMHLYWTYYIINSAVQVHSSHKIIRHNYD